MKYYRTDRNDQGCLWFSRLPREIAGRLRVLAPGSPVTLRIRRAGDNREGVPTRWVRMKTGRDGRLTYGVRIVEGIHLFRQIPLGTEFEVTIQKIG